MLLRLARHRFLTHRSLHDIRVAVATGVSALTPAGYVHTCAVAPKAKTLEAEDDDGPRVGPGGAVKWSHLAPEGVEDDDEDELPGPFYAIRHGRDKFRGVVVRPKEHIALIQGVKDSYGRKEETLEKAIRSYQHHSDQSWRRFFAFRLGGAEGVSRGIVVTQPTWKLIAKRVESRTLEKVEFNNMTQALVFCEQAGTPGTDWHTLERAIRFLARKPELSTPDMMDKYIMRISDLCLF
ncbi:hypothetical protein FVE85_3616 [Porphyridium purpureum]|uniref:Uncharacterized protein n=1 Tax=Porphyridium purpureum TaxID=35688 RepID=A0A5J4YLQ5_PORPP|nr:hypothetical protein FVE85_3616 [Porphyridium purpureum]|eukprot:POR9190..scf249_10